MRVVVRPFSAGETTYERSIAVDASTIGGTMVTVAVSASRSDELDILQSIYRAAEGFPFHPFRDKSHDLDRPALAEIHEEVVSANRDRISTIAHLTGNPNFDQESVEGAQSAVLVNELDPTDALVVLDGNEQKATTFGHSIRGIADEYPPIATCVQSEIYYPASLLADLCASHLAYEINDNGDGYGVDPTTPLSHPDYGAAYNSRRTSTGEVPTVPIEQRQAGKVRQRVNCWFEGTMGGGNPDEFGRSLSPVVNHVRREGYEELARWLSEI